MAVKTKFAKSDIIKILSSYKLGKLLNSKQITKGTVQTNYFIKTTKGEFVFRCYENRSLGSILFEANLIEYLKNKKYPCPTVVKNIHGQIIGSFKSKHYIIFEFIRGDHIQKPGVKQIKQLVKEVAHLHNITKNYRPSNKEFRWNYNIDFCYKLAKKEAEKIGTNEAKEKLKWYKKQLLKLELPRSLPKGICHCDFHFSNVIFKNGKFKALIDFDDANYTYLTFDLVCLFKAFIFSFNWSTWRKFKKTDNVFNFTETKKLVKEYMKYRSLNNIEKEHLFDIYKLSILVDCLWYFKRGDGKDFYEKRKIDYLDNLGRKEFYEELFS